MDARKMNLLNIFLLLLPILIALFFPLYFRWQWRHRRRFLKQQKEEFEALMIPKEGEKKDQNIQQ